ncbi:MAG: hypothetical protein AAFN93_06495 [Bacteroidota bacterium]
MKKPKLFLNKKTISLIDEKRESKIVGGTSVETFCETETYACNCDSVLFCGPAGGNYWTVDPNVCEDNTLADGCDTLGACPTWDNCPIVGGGGGGEATYVTAVGAAKRGGGKC